MLINILGIKLNMKDRGRKLPVIQLPSNGYYHFLAPIPVSLSAGVTVPEHVALVARMDETNLCHESSNPAPELVDGKFHNCFFADEYTPDGFIWLQNRRSDVSSMFSPQGEEMALILCFYMPTQLPDQREEGKTWMGSKWKSEEERRMEQRGMSGMAGLRAGPFKPQPVPAPLQPGYFTDQAFLTVVVEFIPVEDFNALADQEWDPYAEEA